jgi:hypothetical protein
VARASSPGGVGHTPLTASQRFRRGPLGNMRTIFTGNSSHEDSTASSQPDVDALRELAFVDGLQAAKVRPQF